MDDISPELLKQIQEDFTELTAGIQEEVKSGRMSYEEAYGAAFEVGSVLSSAFNANINADVLPDGRMYFNIANKVVLPMLKEEHDLVSQAAAAAQQNANRAAGIGIRAIPAEFDEDRAKGIIDRVSSQPFEEVSWMLDEPVKSFAKNVVDRTLQKNVDFQGQSGLHPKIVRRASAGACEWCQAVAGTYEYPDVPDDVYRRHANCDCTVEYVDGGKYQDVWSKNTYSQEEHDTAIQERIDKANRMIDEKRRQRVRDNSAAPKYERNPRIDALETSEELKSLFPNMVFRKGFDKLDIEVQREVIQGLDYMKRLLGEKAIPVECNATVTGNDLGRTKVRTGKVNLSKELNMDNAFATICHECIHVYDGKRGLVSEGIIKTATENLGMKVGSEDYKRQVLDLLGYKYYIKYKDDPLEIMAYAFEENLYGTSNALALGIYGELTKQ